jgi:uncharacterized phage protein (TIGR01671 family)
MAREIKFRAWDEIKGLWLTHAEISNKICWRADGLMTFLVDHLRLQQYTGLKDNNGVDIFEGDVLAKQDGIHQWKYVVEWGLWGNDDLCIGIGPETENDGKAAGWNILIQDDGSVIYEVIGNIYENPELLK